MTNSYPADTQKLVEELAKLLHTYQLKVATAESCTGGMISKCLTAIAGSSNWFECGFVTYSNESKIRLLGVETKVLHEHGAVSSEVAKQMVLGVLEYSAASIAVSVTGIAGPGGGSAAKPVGTVYIATAQANRNPAVEHYLFEGDRSSVRQQSTHAAITQLIKQLR